MRVAVVLGAPELAGSDLDAIRAADAVVCADGGVRHAMAAGRLPDLVTGDLDSVDAAALTWAEAGGAVIERHPTVKDDTDGELAVDAACRLGADEVMLIGVITGRTAMVLANLRLLRRSRDRGVAAYGVAGNERMRLLIAGEQWRLGDAIGGTFNVLALAQDATVALHGLAWSGDPVVLPVGTARGVSNPVIADDARIEVEQGAVLAILELPRPRQGTPSG
jgi:thiamine pyrophosphokinase